jgi:hypothetical protein
MQRHEHSSPFFHLSRLCTQLPAMRVSDLMIKLEPEWDGGRHGNHVLSVVLTCNMRGTSMRHREFDLQQSGSLERT